MGDETAVSGCFQHMKEKLLSDVIRLKNLTIFGFYGVSPQEREVGQKIQIDLDLHANLEAACSSDSLQDTINYESVYTTVMELVGVGKRYRLLESLGEEICEALLSRYPVNRVDIALRKLNLPFPNNMSFIEIQLSREAPRF
jgi:dihydroneopterin aldolase